MKEREDEIKRCKYRLPAGEDEEAGPSAYNTRRIIGVQVVNSCCLFLSFFSIHVSLMYVNSPATPCSNVLFVGFFFVYLCVHSDRSEV